MRKDRYALIFDKEKIVNLPGVSFVEDDLMDIASECITNFLDQHKSEIIKSIKKKRNYLEEKFREKVLYIFQGGYGIYEKYFITSGKDRVKEFLRAIERKGFQGIEAEKEVIDQFTLLGNLILGEEILPAKLREELIIMLDKKIIKKHTISGAENIAQLIDRIWQNDKKSYSEYLSGEQMVPEKITEIRIPNRLNINEGIIAIFVPEV